MKYYTEKIPTALAERLIFEEGMTVSPTEEFVDGKYTIVDWKMPTYAEVFDWVIEKGIRIYVVWSRVIEKWHGDVNDNITFGHYKDWHEAANAAIEKALTLI